MSETRYTPEQMRDRANSEPCACSIAVSGACSWCAETAAMLRQAATDAEALAEVTAYLTHLLATVAPQCEPLPTAAGIATQIDNYIAGRHKALEATDERIRTLTDALNDQTAGAAAHVMAAKDAELRKRSDVTTAQTIALTKLGDEYASEFNRAESLQAALTAERQKIRELREAVTAKNDGASLRPSPKSAQRALAYASILSVMDSLGLTGDATEGQG